MSFGRSGSPCTAMARPWYPPFFRGAGSSSSLGFHGSFYYKSYEGFLFCFFYELRGFEGFGEKAGVRLRQGQWVGQSSEVYHAPCNQKSSVYTEMRS